MTKEELIKEMAKDIYLKYMDLYLKNTFNPTFDPKRKHQECLERAYDFYKFVDEKMDFK